MRLAEISREPSIHLRMRTMSGMEYMSRRMKELSYLATCQVLCRLRNWTLMHAVKSAQPVDTVDQALDRHSLLRKSQQADLALDNSVRVDGDGAA